jgi:TetR/AcrR family transcriptional repressor of nem operon
MAASAKCRVRGRWRARASSTKAKSSTVERYGARLGEALEGIQDEPSPRAALGGLLRALLVESSPQSGPRGCFLLCSAVGGNAPHAALVAYTDYTVRLERALTALVGRGQEMGELTRAAEAPAVARMLVVFLQGVSAAARAGRTKAQLATAVETVLALVAPPA